MFESRLSREFLEEKLSKLKKRNYNQFVWWRRYQNRETLHPYRTLHDKIANGDYEPSDYYYQAEHEKISLFRARYKKLHEDFLKEEQEIMNNLRKDFWKEFRIDKEELDKMMEDFDGTVMDLYNHAVQLKNERVESRKPMPKVSVL
jgi:hypothetical protein